MKAVRKRSFWDLVFGTVEPPRRGPKPEPIHVDDDPSVQRVREEVGRARERRREMKEAFGDIAHDMRNETDAIRREQHRRGRG